MENLKSKLCSAITDDITTLVNLFKDDKSGKLTLFMPQIGENFCDSMSRLMVVGRSPNSWGCLHLGVALNSLVNDQFLGEGLESQWTKRATVSDNSNNRQDNSVCCQCSPIAKICHRPKSSHYAFNRSAFWQCVQYLAQRIPNFSASEVPSVREWSSQMIWTNLHKIGTDEGIGTPDSDLRKKQLELSKEILRKEIQVLKPSMIVLLTDWDGWADQFILQKKPTEEKITRMMSIRFKGEWNGIKTVVLPHPQGKSGRAECLNEVIEFARHKK
jgi:hypothetical protein